MENKKNNEPIPEVTDTELDDISGGVSHRTERKAPCTRCGHEFPALALLGGYCSECLDELHKMGVYPPI